MDTKNITLIIETVFSFLEFIFSRERIFISYDWETDSTLWVLL